MMQAECEKLKSRRLRFTYDDDVTLLREVVAQNPLSNPEQWEVVQINVERVVNKKFQIRTLKQHLQLLLEVFQKKEQLLKIRSGEEEPHSQRDALLLEVNTMASEYSGPKRQRTSSTKDKKISDLGREARDRFSNMFSSEDIHETNFENNSSNVVSIVEEESTVKAPIIATSPFTNPDDLRVLSEPKPSSSTAPLGTNKQIRRRVNKSQVLRRDAFSYLNDKSEKEYWLKKKELELQERKIVVEEKRVQNKERKLILEERKFEIDLQERTQRLELERERLKVELNERKTLMPVCTVTLKDSLTLRSP